MPNADNNQSPTHAPDPQWSRQQRELARVFFGYKFKLLTKYDNPDQLANNLAKILARIQRDIPKKYQYFFYKTDEPLYMDGYERYWPREMWVTISNLKDIVSMREGPHLDDKNYLDAETILEWAREDGVL